MLYITLIKPLLRELACFSSRLNEAAVELTLHERGSSRVKKRERIVDFTLQIHSLDRYLTNFVEIICDSS